MKFLLVLGLLIAAILIFQIGMVVGAHPYQELVRDDASGSVLSSIPKVKIASVSSEQKERFLLINLVSSGLLVAGIVAYWLGRNFIWRK